MSRLRFASAAALAGALLTLPGSMLAARPALPTVTITIGSHFYRPNPIHLAGGVPVRLIFVNRAGVPHDFKAPQFFQSARILTGAAASGKIALAAGRGTTVTLIPRRGRYKVHCSRPFHAMMGMQGWIVVA